MLRGRVRTAAAVIATVTAATGIAACGSSTSGGSSGGSTDAPTLIKQAFSSGSAIKSGKVSVRIVITPTGSSIISSPITLSMSGPIVQAEKGQLPQSDLTINFSGLGKHGSFGVTSTTSAAYVTIDQTSYKLPAADFQKLKQSAAQGTSTDTLPGLSALGIDPENWLSNPQLVGTEQVDGTQTEHISAALNVARAIADVNTLLTKEASKLHAPAGTDHISPATAKKITAAIKRPTIDLWVGKSDTVLRRIQLGATVPVSGTTSTQLGGLTSATFKVTADATDVNQPQTITAPANPKSYRALQGKLQAIVQSLGGLGGLGSGGSVGGGSAGPATSSKGSAAQVNKYSKCINNAKGDVTKMQKCASLLNGSGG